MGLGLPRTARVTSVRDFTSLVTQEQRRAEAGAVARCATLSSLPCPRTEPEPLTHGGIPRQLSMRQGTLLRLGRKRVHGSARLTYHDAPMPAGMVVVGSRDRCHGARCGAWTASSCAVGPK